VDRLKKSAFAIVNGVVLLTTLVLFFWKVFGRKEELVDLEKKLDSDRTALIALASRKPTQEWHDLVKKNIDRVKGGLQSIEDGPKLADEKIHWFFDLTNPAGTTKKVPSINDYSVFKEIMVKKWDGLIGAFCAEAGPFSLPATVLKNLEPDWLRSDAPPTHEGQVVEAMKNYWIVTGLLETLSELKIARLSMLKVSSLVRTPLYQVSEKDFWGYRQIEIEGQIDASLVEELFKVFSQPENLYRVTGFSFTNVISTPPGVFSDASFLGFASVRPQQVFKLNLMHFDYLSEGESFDPTTGPGVGVPETGADRRPPGRRR